MLGAGRLGCAAWCWFVACALSARVSTGQPASAKPKGTERPNTSPTADSAATTRPVPIGTLEVAYPEGQTETAIVVLELVVTRDGTVREAQSVQGPEPFASAAVRAASAFRFEPALRGGEPVAARIRFQVHFEPPSPQGEEPAGGAPRAPTSEGASAPEPSPEKTAPAIELLVLGERAAPARISLGRAEVRELPGAFGDPFRAIEVLPGVTPIFTGVPFFYVRGSPPGNVGYFLDGIRVPLLFHVALGPSVIHPGLVERVDLYPGGYPARYGRFGGAIVAAETTPPSEEFRGEANVRIFDAGALVEAPFAGGRGSALVGGRYSYTAAALSLLAPEVTLTYWDYQARLSYELSPRWRAGVFAFGAYDLFRSDEDDASIGTQFHRLDLRADYTPSPRTALRFAGTVGLDRSGAQDPDGSADEDEPVLRDRLLSIRADLDHQLDTKTRVRAGADFGLDRYEILDVQGEDGDAARLFYTRDDITGGLHGDLVWEPEAGVVITPGVRADVYLSGRRGALALEPRVAAEFAVGPRVTLEHTFGVAHQAPSFIVPVPGFQLSDLKDGLQRTIQSSAGVLVRPGSGFQLGLTLFHNVFLNLTDFLGTVSLREQAFGDEGDDEDRIDLRSLGQGYGLEVSIRRAMTQRLGGYFAYTLSRTTRSLGRAHQPASFDRTHVLHAALGYALGRNWHAGGRFTFYTGAPAQRNYDEVRSNPIAAAIEPAYRRGPAFYRLDLRLEKRWPIAPDGRYWSFVVEMLNSTLHREVPFYSCDADGCEGEAVGPVTIPSIGVEVFF